MEAKTNYTMVGLAVLILTTSLIVTSLWLSVGFNQKKYKLYAVYINEAVSGLSEESIVKFNGVPVGYVKKIELNPLDPQKVTIMLDIEDGTPITTSTTATLISQGITGTTFIGLAASSPDLTPLQKLPEEPYPIIPARPSLFNQLDSILKEVSENVHTVSVEIKKVLNDENVTNLKKSLAHIEKFTGVFADNKENIDKSLKNTNILLKNMAKTSDKLPEIMKDLKTSIGKVSSTMDSGKTALDKLSQQTIPPAVQLLKRLDAIAANLEQVSAEMRQNPAVIIRGTKPPKPGPGE